MNIRLNVQSRLLLEENMEVVCTAKFKLFAQKAASNGLATEENKLRRHMKVMGYCNICCSELTGGRDPCFIHMSTCSTPLVGNETAIEFAIRYWFICFSRQSVQISSGTYP
jgi:hypothetical protein